MLKIKTRNFGEIEVPEDKVLDFEEAIPGFPKSKRFVLIEEPKEGASMDGLFYWLQSLDETDIALILMDVTKIMPEYLPQVEAEDLDSIGDITTDPYYFYNVVVIHENIEKMSVNLKAPIVINDRLKKGKQMLSSNEDYPIRYYIIEEMDRK